MRSGLSNVLSVLATVTVFALSISGAEAASWGRVRDVAMQMRENGDAAGAYNLVAGVHPSNAEEYVDEQFTSGFLALRALGRSDLALTHFEAMALATANLRADQRPDARSTAGYYMGRALTQLGRPVDAEKVYAAAASYRDTFYGLLAANQIHATDTRAQLAAVAGNYPVLDVKYFDPRTNAALINAIIKPESNFRFDAVSPAGALGLMQLMPETAAKTARSAGVEVSMNTVAYNPTINVAIGSRHFGDLLTRYSNNVMIAAGAYNAGSLRTDEWIHRFGDPRGGGIDAVDWVELIPFKETRLYVKKVVAAYVTYLTLSQR